MREIDPNIWITYVLLQTQTENKKYIIEDIRYQNELNTLKNNWKFLKLKISSELQKKRITKTYPLTYNTHLLNMYHNSETELDNIKDTDFNLVIDVDTQDVFDTLSKWWAK